MTKSNFIRYFATLILGCLLFSQAYAQHITEFQFSETAPDNIRNIMQTNAEAVFAEINRACEQNTALSLLPANVTDEAGKRIHSLWANSHFYCNKTNIKEMVWKSSNGYQVRNIPVFIENGDKLEDKYQDMVIEFDKDCKISDLYIALSQRQHAIIMDSSNDASESYTNIQFDEIAVKQHESDPNIYGVTFKQYWTSGDYHDEGWLFLLVDHSKGEEKPIMLERRWYPTIDPKTGKKIHYSTEDIFKLSDFPVSK